MNEARQAGLQLHHVELRTCCQLSLIEFLPSSPPGASGAASVCTLGRHITMSRSLPGRDRPDTNDPKAFTCMERVRMGEEGKEGR